MDLKDGTSMFYNNLKDGTENIKTVINNYNVILENNFKRPGTPESSTKLDLFKRIDVYSLGILLLDCIRKFIEFNKNTLSTKENELLNNFINIAYTCCIQNEQVADINIIEKDWSSYLLDIKSISSPDIVVEPKTKDVAISGAGATSDKYG